MTNLALADPKLLLRQHGSAIKDYAERAVVCGEDLNTDEWEDLRGRMKEFLAMGNAFKLTEKELVCSLYKELFAPRRGCGCHGCRARVAVAS